MKTEEPPRFEDALKQLEDVVAKLEKGELSLEESLKLYEQGIALSRHCHQRLEEAEGKIELLLKDARGDVAVDAKGAPRVQPLSPEDDDDRP